MAEGPYRLGMATFFRELRSGGLLFVEALEGSEDQVAFRTLVQLDGDICTCVHADLLNSDTFHEQAHAHLDRVRSSLMKRLNKTRRWLDGITWLCSGSVLIGSYAFGSQVLTASIYPAALLPISSAGLALLSGMAASWLIRIWLRSVDIRLSE